jgi:TPR repeat protein
LGFVNFKAEGVPQNYAEALRLWKLAAAQEHASAIGGIGELYEGGFSVSKDIQEAKRWWKRAAALGNQEAAAQLRKYP